MSQTPPLHGYHLVDFSIVKEKWNKYKLEDGTQLKTKFNLLTVHFEKDTDELMEEFDPNNEGLIEIGTNINIQHKIVIGVSSPENLQGIPNEKKGQDLREQIDKEDLDILEPREPFFEYRLKNGFILKGKAVLMHVDRTNVYDSRGMPIYLVNHSIEMKMIPPQSWKKTIEKRRKKGAPKISLKE